MKKSRENITQKERDSLIADLESFASNYPNYSVTLGSTTSSNDYWHTVYYNCKIDNIYDAVEHNPENIVAYINVDSFDNEIIKCSEIVKNNETGESLLRCDECYTAWNNPEQIKRNNASGLVLDILTVDPTEIDIEKWGWEKYILKK